MTLLAGQDKCRPALHDFLPGAGVKINLTDVASLRNVHYISLPAAGMPIHCRSSSLSSNRSLSLFANEASRDESSFGLRRMVGVRLVDSITVSSWIPTDDVNTLVKLMIVAPPDLRTVTSVMGVPPMRVGFTC